jgi:DNA-binding response OmpR family regulator
MTALESSRVDVLIADLGLPGVSGADLARRARALRQEVGVIFATGRSQLEAEQLDGAILLGKPYRAVDLEQAIGKLGLGHHEV